MFSIIICSINPVYLEQVTQSLDKTIGAPYELLVWDNRKTNKGLCEVYNMLAAQATQPICCFIHEDIIFRTVNWGQLLLEAFESDSSIGLIGVAGPVYKSKTPSGWATGLSAIDRVNILHLDPQGHTTHLLQNPAQSVVESVVCLDGVFLCTPSAVWRETRFDQESLKGFHLYDLDFSLRVGETHKLIVHYGMGITHLTAGGNFGDDWVETTLRWQKSHSLQLPVSLLRGGVDRNPERRITKKCLHRLRNERISLRNKFRWIWECGAMSDASAWPFVGLFLFPGIYNRLRVVTKIFN